MYYNIVPDNTDKTESTCHNVSWHKRYLSIVVESRKYRYHVTERDPPLDHIDYLLKKYILIIEPWCHFFWG